MNKILYRVDEKKDILLIFFINCGKGIIFFKGDGFQNTTWESIKNTDLYEELKYSIVTKDKAQLEIEELKHDDHKVYYIKLVNGDIFEIKNTIYGYGEIAQRLFIVKKKISLKKYDTYELSVLAAFQTAQMIRPS